MSDESAIRRVQINVPAKAPRKAPRSAFKPGQSGNPTGRPKALGELTALARAYAPECVPVLMSIIHNERAAAVARVSAVSLLWERGYGKATQPIDMNIQSDIVALIEAGRVRARIG